MVGSPSFNPTAGRTRSSTNPRCDSTAAAPQGLTQPMTATSPSDGLPTLQLLHARYEVVPRAGEGAVERDLHVVIHLLVALGEYALAVEALVVAHAAEGRDDVLVAVPARARPRLRRSDELRRPSGKIPTQGLRRGAALEQPHAWLPAPDGPNSFSTFSHAKATGLMRESLALIRRRSASLPASTARVRSASTVVSSVTSRARAPESYRLT